MGTLNLKTGHRRQSALPRAGATHRAATRHIGVRSPHSPDSRATEAGAIIWLSAPRASWGRAPTCTRAASAPAGPPPPLPPTGEVLCTTAAARSALIPPPLHRGTTHTLLMDKRRIHL
jgi:hypothetical protein